MYILSAIITLGVLVLIHELGHFIMAKANGVKVEEFSIGMGPKLIGIKGKETEYLIKIVPFGGYIKMLGEEGGSTDSRAFNNKSAGSKLSIVAAGPFMNFILAIILFSAIGGIKGYNIPTIDKVIPNSPAEVAGIKSGDKIIKINNKSVGTWEEVVNDINTAKGAKLNIAYLRNGNQLVSSVTPKFDSTENRLIIGISPVAITNPNIFQSVGYGFKESGFLIKETFNFFKTLFHGGLSMNDFGGPVTIIKVSGEAAKAGFLNLIYIGAYLSIQFAIFNIIPFPALDGGYIFLFIYELLSGKKVNEQKIGYVNYIGFAILMTLMVLITIKDILYPLKL